MDNGILPPLTEEKLSRAFKYYENRLGKWRIHKEDYDKLCIGKVNKNGNLEFEASKSFPVKITGIKFEDL